MSLLAELERRFAAAVEPIGRAGGCSADEIAELARMVRPSQDKKFGDYQANAAMPLAKRLGKPPREVAQDLVSRLDVADICHPPEVAGAGFINFRLRDEWLADKLARAERDQRLGVENSASPRTIVIDYSAPNVAKPMHVGHIRSTVIGDALYRVLRFLGHDVIGDNHLGDWGTQFGMVIYGYRHFLDEAAYRASPVDELARLYRLVNRLVDYHEGRAALPDKEQAVALAAESLEKARVEAGAVGTAGATAAGKQVADPKTAAKQAAKAERKALDTYRAAGEALVELRAKLKAVDDDPQLAAAATAHPRIGEDVLAETARLHEDDAESLRLWREFMPPCLEAINRVYRRLDVRFDHTLGESFYHDRLASVVDDLAQRGIARESGGAMCVFTADDAPPLIIRKQDGAFLYGTTDLATIAYRMETWRPDAILYVVDHRQSLHFEQLFAAARKWGYTSVELYHVSFGTVLGENGRPYKTRSGQTVDLMGLLDEAVARALDVVMANDQAAGDGTPATKELGRIAETVGIGAVKYADLSQNRTSDYVFSYDKMLAMNGNTATYMQYAYARVQSIFRKGGVSPGELANSPRPIRLDSPAERGLALELVRFAEALDNVVADYRPNQLTAYLFELANRYSTFFEECPVLRAETDELRESRLRLCDLTARTIKLGLELLGIGVVEQM